jgi:hypothetical protein
MPTFLVFAHVALAAALTFCTTHVEASPGLSLANFKEVGDGITDMLNTSGLTFAVLDAGAAATRVARPRQASIGARAADEAPAVESPCPGGGSVSVTRIDTDASGDLSTGDRFASVFNACAVDGGVMTGRSSFVVSAYRVDGSAEVVEFDFNCEDLGTDDLRWTGLAHLVLRSDLKRGTEHYRVTYRDLAVTRGTRRMRWNFSLDVIRPPIGSGVAGVDGEASIDEVHLTLRQDEVFVVSDSGLPGAGQLTAYDDHGARLQVQAGRRRYAYRLFLPANSSNVPDVAAPGRPYPQR